MTNKNFILIAIIIILFFISVDNLIAYDNVDATANLITSIASEEGESGHQQPDALIVIPFIVLLLMIATGPLFYRHLWEHHYPKVAIVLGLITVFYYLIFLKDTHSLMHTITEYLSFIALLSSLFVASGGILIRVDKKATPLLNITLLAFGAVISNIIGTTGASMLLIRPYIKINQDRIKPYHIIFFIFVVSNIGGGLTPIGDPPLFLGFLRGVQFFWVIQHVWYIWIPTIVLILSLFYVIDSFNKSGSNAVQTYSGKIDFKGLKNLFYLAIIIISVFLDPAVLSFVPSFAPLPFGIREIIMFSVVYLSYKNADQEALKGNEFDFEPIREVAYLFAGLFATMIPALQLIAYEAHELRDELNAGLFYWFAGSLSAFLDNAPTYLNFLSAAMGKYGMEVNDKMQVFQFQLGHALYLKAISVGAVFFGALSYIGNAPNFMVKSISERSGIDMPSFFTYMVKYSIPILIPIFIIIWAIFFS